MPSQLSAALTCVAAIGLLGLAQLFRLWDLETLPRRWKEYGRNTRCGFFLSLVFVIASTVGFGVYQAMHSTQVPLLLLLGFFWLYGLIIEAFLFWRTRVLILQIFAFVLSPIASVVQIVGIFISCSLDSLKGRAIAASGYLVFHWCAIGFITYYLRQGYIKDRKFICFVTIWFCIFTATIGFVFIPNEVGFYLGWRAWKGAERNNRGDSDFSFSCLSRENRPPITTPNDSPFVLSSDSAPRSHSANSGLESYKQDTTANNNGEPQNTQIITTALRQPDGLGGISSIYHILDITGSANGLSARVLTERKTEEGTSMLQLVIMDWAVLNRCWAMNVKEKIGKFAYDNILHFAVNGAVPGRILFAGQDVDEFVYSKDVGALIEGYPVCLKRAEVA
ncbi:hypothetical protein CC78DRAFT_544492 [Lojkania enalia]|uniref:Uncharacterized protein n=1 Tax=Lojkania enalia TaxID=147567 RepID=A0A9P4K8X4_9PLEO|nr:hypothetical protein CC78DRAFT_544492 [Didymosphaeria enalia]